MTPLAAAKAPVKVGDPLAFYEVAATIIPVLFIAMLFEVKLLEPFVPPGAEKPPTDLPEYLMGVVFLAFGIFGEVASLEVLATQRPSTAAHGAAVAALVILTVGVIARPMTSAIRPMTQAKGVVVAILLVFLTLAILIGAGLWGSSTARDGGNGVPTQRPHTAASARRSPSPR